MCEQIICDRDHRCQKVCHYGEECGKCKVMIEKLRPECQHMVRVECSGNPSLVWCASPCEKNRTCGHKCTSCCGAICDKTFCKEKIQVESPCGHKVTVKCSDANDFSKLLGACNEPCRVELKCQHLCKGSCGECKLGRLHIR